MSHRTENHPLCRSDAEIGTIGFAGILNQMDTIALVKVTGCQEGMNRVMSFAT
jgi:hypothetical protein